MYVRDSVIRLMHESKSRTVILALFIKTTKEEIKELHRLNTDRSLSRIISNKYSRLNAAKLLLDYSFLIQVDAVLGPKGYKERIDSYLEFILLNRRKNFMMLKVNANSHQYTLKYAGRNIKHKRFNTL